MTTPIMVALIPTLVPHFAFRRSGMPTNEIEALQNALAGEHACVFGYGVIGARIGEDDQGTALDLLDAHAERGDALAKLVRSADETPVAAFAVYELPFEVTGTESARELAAELERRLAQVYADLVAAASSADVREAGVNGLVAAARRAAQWSGKNTAFPGLRDRPNAPIP